MTDQELAVKIAEAADALNGWVLAASRAGITCGVALQPRNGQHPPKVRVKAYRELCGEITAEDMQE